MLSPGHPEGDVINGTSRLCQLFKGMDIGHSSVHAVKLAQYCGVALVTPAFLLGVGLVVSASKAQKVVVAEIEKLGLLR